MTKTPEKLSEIIETRFRRSQEEMLPEYRQLFKEIDNQYKGIAGEIELDPHILWLVFYRPDISHTMHLAVARTTEKCQKAVHSQDESKLREFPFSVSHTQEEGILVSDLYMKMPWEEPLPTGTVSDLQTEIHTVSPHRTGIFMFHTHPGYGRRLAPSVIEHSHLKPGKYGGDLFAFVTMQQFRQEDMRRSHTPEFASRPVTGIFQPDYEDETVKLLLIRESESLAKLSISAYIARLKFNAQRMAQAQNETTVRGILSELGYLTSYFNIPTTEFFNYPIFTPEEYNQACHDLLEAS